MAQAVIAIPSDSESEDEDDNLPSHGRGRVLGTDEYIGRVVGAKSDGETDSERETRHESRISEREWRERGKRKSGERVEWTDDEDEDAYERFKNRKATKRKKMAATKTSIKAKAKSTAERKKLAKANGESAPRKERVWDDVQEEYDEMAEEIPEYLIKRRKEFDQKYQELKEASLKLPPRYHNIDFSDIGKIADLEERPAFGASVEPSREYKDIELVHSGGVIPASIARYLRDYQVEGVAFLHELYVYQKGGILGDDMGLGKTVQVAAFLTAAFGKTGDLRDSKRMRKMRRLDADYPRVLIVCPGSLIENWKNELERWGWWHAEKYHGSSRESSLLAAKSGRLEVLITTYTTYKNDMSKINMVEWDCVVADECHILKEVTSATTQAMFQVNALCRIGLTGTAIQNKYEELWTLLNWTNPGRFGPISTWKESISTPLRIGQSHDATYHQLKVARGTAKKLVHNLLPQFFLRRMKSLIAHQLPKKTDRVVFCPLSDIQKEAYENFLASDIVDLVRRSGDMCECESGAKRGWCCHANIPGTTTSWKTLVFAVITKLQKLSNHLALLLPDVEQPMDKQQRDLEYLQMMLPDQWEELYQQRDSIKNLANPNYCGKWKILKKLLQYWHSNGDKVLIFSHSVRLLRMLQYLFNNTSYNVSFLSGETHLDERQTIVDEFNSDPGQFVFLISTRAGGVGLNITSANKVVIFDPNWNPSYDLQAQDRAYRIGQLRDVEVFRLVSAGTVEEIVYARQIYKQQQANIGYNASTERRYFKGVQNAPGQKGEIFGLDNLLTFHDNEVVLRDIVNKTNVAEAKRGVDILEVDMDDALNDDDNPLRLDDDKDENGAMSQLAALLTEDSDSNKRKSSKANPKTDAILAILASAGVEYTHENSEVVGSSKVEAELSRRAEEAGNDVDYGEERLFAESQSHQDAPNLNGRINYQYHPPEDVMLRQFCTMAQTFGFGTATDFALVVEGWTQKQRRDCLERFYLKRKERLIAMQREKKEGDGGSAIVFDEDTTLGDVGDSILDSISPEGMESSHVSSMDATAGIGGTGNAFAGNATIGDIDDYDPSGTTGLGSIKVMDSEDDEDEL